MHAKTWYTRLPASKYAQTHANHNHSPILTKIQCCIPPFQIFRRLNALFTALWMQKRGTLFFQCRSKPRHPANRNHSSNLSKIKRYSSPVWDISTFNRSLHCIRLVECIARVFQSRNKPIYTQIVIIFRFWRKLSVICLPFEIFRRLNPPSTALCVRYVVHAILRVKTSPDTPQIAITLGFCRKWSVVSLPFEIFRCYNALFTALCLWNAVHAFSSVEVSPGTPQIAIIRWFRRK